MQFVLFVNKFGNVCSPFKSLSLLLERQKEIFNYNEIWLYVILKIDL